MKNLFFTLLFLLLIYITASAQSDMPGVFPNQARTDSITPGKMYKAWLNVVEEPQKRKGVLFEIKDSSVMISNSLNKQDYFEGRYDVSQFDIRNLEGMKIRKKGNVGKGAIIGMATGLIIGGILAIVTVNNHPKKGFHIFSPGEEAMIVSLPFIPLGAGIGAAIGSAQIRIPINRSQEQFNLKKPMLNNYAIKPIPVISDKTFSVLRDTVVDMDGNLYHTLALGGQLWMAEDLKVTRYADGTGIKNGIKDASEGGYLYNWNAVNNSRKLCPTGWHVPSVAEWISLYNSLGADNSVAGKLHDKFSSDYQIGQWWSSTEKDSITAQHFYLNNETMAIMTIGANKKTGLRVRCLRD